MSDGDGEQDSPERGLPVSRRDLLGAGVGVALGAGAALGPDIVAADPQGGVGTATNPVQAAYLEELRGPIVDEGNTITQLVDHRVAEEGASISPSAETLVFRYDPNTTV